MAKNNLRAGHIIRYPYLWKREQDRGETEGRKTRPVCLVVATVLRGETYLYLLPISSQPPAEGQTTLEIPDMELRRAGLKTYKQAWVTVSEHKRDIAERSFYYQPSLDPIGSFSAAFLLKIQQAALPFFRSRTALVSGG